MNWPWSKKTLNKRGSCIGTKVDMRLVAGFPANFLESYQEVQKAKDSKKPKETGGDQ